MAIKAYKDAQVLPATDGSDKSVVPPFGLSPIAAGAKAPLVGGWGSDDQNANSTSDVTDPTAAVSSASQADMTTASSEQTVPAQSTSVSEQAGAQANESPASLPTGPGTAVNLANKGVSVQSKPSVAAQSKSARMLEAAVSTVTSGASGRREKCASIKPTLNLVCPNLADSF